MDSCAESNNQSKGPLNFSGPEFICIGKVHRTHGIRGDVIFNPMTDFPERIRRGKMVYAGDAHRPLKVQRVRSKPPYLLIGFADLTDETQAAELRNVYLYVRSDELPPLPEGEYYFHELIGLEAIDEQGAHVGILNDIMETGANDVYIIRKDDGTEELIPAIPDFILEVLMSTRQIRVRMPEWI